MFLILIYSYKERAFENSQKIMSFLNPWCFLLYGLVLGCLPAFINAGEALLTQAEVDKFRAQLDRVAGVYKDPVLANKYNLKKTVVITGCNHGFLNHLYNFDCFMRRLGMKYLVITMDSDAENVLANMTNFVTFPITGGISAKSTLFREKQFNLITARKKAAVHSIMQLGYDVLFSDTDVALLRDPFPYLLWRNVDYVHSLNGFCLTTNYWDGFFKSRSEGNTGFYYVKATNQTINLWAAAYAATAKHPKLDDQAVFWKVIRQSKDPQIVPLGRCRHYDNQPITSEQGVQTLVTCLLDTCVFSSGMISRLYEPEMTYETLQLNLKQLKETAAAIHANYMSGNAKKMGRLQEHGLWLADIDPSGVSYTCREFKPLPEGWIHPATLAAAAVAANASLSSKNVNSNKSAAEAAGVIIIPASTKEGGGGGGGGKRKAMRKSKGNRDTTE